MLASQSFLKIYLGSKSNKIKTIYGIHKPWGRCVSGGRSRRVRGGRNAEYDLVKNESEKIVCRNEVEETGGERGLASSLSSLSSWSTWFSCQISDENPPRNKHSSQSNITIQSLPSHVLPSWLGLASASLAPDFFFAAFSSLSKNRLQVNCQTLT